jgi:hypothetical protein
VARVQLLADQIPLVASFGNSAHQVDLDLLSLGAAVDRVSSSCLSRSPGKLDFKTVCLLDRLALLQRSNFVEEKGNCLLGLEGNCDRRHSVPGEVEYFVELPVNAGVLDIYNVLFSLDDTGCESFARVSS